jgi:hypothetical protein
MPTKLEEYRYKAIRSHPIRFIDPPIITIPSSMLRHVQPLSRQELVEVLEINISREDLDDECFRDMTKQLLKLVKK